MNIQIETQDVSLPANSLPKLRKQIARSMNNVSEQINRLHLTMRDVNGAKGGYDKVCTVRATLVDGGELLVMDRSNRLPRALFRGLRRIKRSIRRDLKRRRRITRGRSSDRGLGPYERLIDKTRAEVSRGS